MQAKWTIRNTGSPSGDCKMNQLATRERQAGPTGMAERLVLPMKPGNSGGGKGGSVEGGHTKRRRKGRLAMNLTPPKLFPEVANGVTCNGNVHCVRVRPR